MITIAGDPCTGKSAIAKNLEKEHNFERFSMGDAFREIAKKYDVDVNELNKLCNQDINDGTGKINIDHELDTWLVDLGNTRTRDYVIIETRTGVKLVKQAHKVYVTCSPEEQVRRLQNSGRDTEDTSLSAEETLKLLNERQALERERFIKLYDVDIMDKTIYSQVVDTTKLTISQGADQVLDGYMHYRQQKFGEDAHTPTLTIKHK